MAGQEGDCGSLHALSRHAQSMRESFDELLYRPWAFGKPTASSRFHASVLAALRKWSLTGTQEYALFQGYSAQFDRTVEILAAFYRSAFGWNQQDATTMATSALASAVSAGFAFSAQYEPFTNASQRKLRTALLERRPLAEIRAIELDFPPFGPPLENQLTTEGETIFAASESDSELNLAIHDPDTLEYLLNKGFDPDSPNEFGKTPLMYAAQANALGAVRLLLAHGANPNAETIEPWDRCRYTVNSKHVTPLHYAVRYGSAALVDLLLDNGAVPFITAQTEWAGDPSFPPVGHPRDWLAHYAGTESKERNRNIETTELLRLDGRLRVPSSTELAELSGRLTRQAEAEYAAGKLIPAYRRLRIALHADPDNLQALSDMSLVAMKAGEPGVALQSSARLLRATTTRDPELAATASFNSGLTCLQVKGYHQYDGENYCTSGLVEPFLQSWLARPSDARAVKLQSLFVERAVPACVVTASEGEPTYVHAFYGARAPQRDQRQYLYVYQPAGRPVQAEEIGWSVTGNVRSEGRWRLETRTVQPHFVERHALGRGTLSIFESEANAAKTLGIRAMDCVLY